VAANEVSTSFYETFLFCFDMYVTDNVSTRQMLSEFQNEVK